MSENRNFLIAAGLSIFVLLAWQYFIVGPQMEEQRARQAALEQSEAEASGDVPAVRDETGEIPSAPGAAVPGGAADAVEMSRAMAIAQSPRVIIDTPTVDGSISLKGGRLDDLSFKDYRETVDPESPEIVLLSPKGSPLPYYADFGWTVAPGAEARVPGADTQWEQVGTGTLTPETPVTLRWDNGAGLIFERVFSVDDKYMFTVTQRVTNQAGAAVTLFPYGLLQRTGTPQISGFYILHEGLLGYFSEDGLQEIDYEDLREQEAPQVYNSTGGWFGITDKYWMTAFAPAQDAQVKVRYTDRIRNGRDVYQADYLGEGAQVAPGSTAEVSSRLFAGAKVVSVIDGYEAEHGIKRFDLAIDWGWFYFLTKPLFLVLDFFAQLIGNFGIAILLLTVLIKLVFFPLANKSYEAMSKMKKLQPELVALRERYGDDRMRQQQEMMELYKREKVNPMAGCLPMVIQIPVFFALYKVLFVTIEMRHAPFFGWVQDLSAPDPTSLFNLFGLLPFDPTAVPVIGAFLAIGVWPLLMGISMFLQTKMNPAPADPMQQKIFTWMPIFFVFLLASFPAGLVIYWTWNNVLSIAQQYVIMRRQGVEVDWNLDWLKKLPGLKARDTGTRDTGTRDTGTRDSGSDS